MATTCCLIQDCASDVFARGWCKSHWHRWRRHGDPLSGRQARGSLLTQLHEAIASQTDECVLWSERNRNAYGYPTIRYNGASRRAHRIVCEIAHGKPPFEKAHAAHSCGVRACVNPRHLRWATGSENQKDRVAHGTSARGERNHKTSLTADMVKEIRRIWATGDCTQPELAAAFGITQSGVSSIVTGKNWGWLE